MKRPSPRLLTSLAIGALAVFALSIDLPHPRTAAPFATLAADSAPKAPAAPAWHEHADTLHSGETLSGLLARGGVSSGAMARILDAADAIDERRVRAGMPVFVRSRGADSTPSEIVFQLAVDRLLHVTRTGDSTWTSREERLPWKTDTVAVSGTIDENLYQALDDSASKLLPTGARAELAWSIADIYEYRVDMSRELQPGDRFSVLFERSVGPGGMVRIGDILAVRFFLSGAEVDAVRYANREGRALYYDQTGRSMRAAFLRAPLAFRRISSTFGLRKHPILGTWRAHKGTDYAAASGTPVRAIGDGTVIFAGRRGGYGNMVEIRHRNGFVSRYGHLRGFASGIRPGRAVSIGQTIAYVGMTGLATGPHLHFEILVHGVQRDPSVALARQGGEPLPAGERSRFDTVRGTLLAALDSTRHTGQFAMR
ncbi:MAG TPA: M23 family metallopeptidase [Gemmatimonadaceae bacterium]|nr:M23 family metallopeptidase [Gemmatimonadaceae bacterium]